MSKKLLGVLVDVRNETVQALETVESQENFCSILGCCCTDAVQRNIGGRPFVIVCDDEALLSEAPKISAVDRSGQAHIFGSIFITGPYDRDGELTGLSEPDAAYVLSRIRKIRTDRYPAGYPVLTGCA